MNASTPIARNRSVPRLPSAERRAPGSRQTPRFMRHELASSVTLTRSSDSLDSCRWVEMQQRCFLRWVESKLRSKNISVSSIEDLMDGSVLAALLEVLTGEKVVGIAAHPRNPFQKAVNCQAVVKFITGHGVRLVNVGATDICDGDIKIMLGLLWVLILHFEVDTDQQDATDMPPTDPSPAKHRGRSGEPRTGLLEWVQRTIPAQNVTNFTTCWNDGWSLVRLVEALEQHVFEQVPDDTMDRIAFVVAYAVETMGIPALVEPTDMADPLIDRKAMVTYIAQFRAYKKRSTSPGKPTQDQTPKRVEDPSDTQRGNPLVPVRTPVVFDSVEKAVILEYVERLVDRNEQRPSARTVSLSPRVFDEETTATVCIQKEIVVETDGWRPESRQPVTETVVFDEEAVAQIHVVPETTTDIHDTVCPPRRDVSLEPRVFDEHQTATITTPAETVVGDPCGEQAAPREVFCAERFFDVEATAQVFRPVEELVEDACERLRRPARVPGVMDEPPEVYLETTSITTMVLIIVVFVLFITGVDAAFVYFLLGFLAAYFFLRNTAGSTAVTPPAGRRAPSWAERGSQAMN